jgi:non-ribosomal peptide synthetase-like protein
MSILLRAASFLYLVVVMAIVGIASVPGVMLVAAAWRTGSEVLTAIALGVGYLAFGITYLALVLAIKTLTFFRAREGDYAFVSPYAVHWALVGTLVSVAKVVILKLFIGQPVLVVFYRLMGARIGKNVLINSCNLFDFELLDIGDDAFIGGDAVVIGHAAEGGRLKLRKVKIGKRCTVGQSSIVFPGAVMEDGSILGAMSLLPKGRVLPARSVWGGNPLVEIRKAPAAAPAGEGA